MSRQARVGLLVLAGGLLFVVALFALANRSFLFSNTFYVKAQFSRVSGLVTGASVQYQGVNVGRVESVQLPATPGQKIVVTMAISADAKHLVRQNTQAQIKSEGLVGNMIIVLAAPPQVGQPVDEGDFIIGVDPFDVFEITDKALASVRQFEASAIILEQIMLDVQRGQGTLGKFIYDPTLYDAFVATTNETEQVLGNLAANAEALVGLAGEATKGVQGILDKVENGEGTIAKFLNDPGVYNALMSTSDSLRAMSGDLRIITANAENAANWGSLSMYRLAELMEAAKHNWLFKRYFEERGHMEQAPFEVRERALAETYNELERQQRELFEWEQRLKALEARLNPDGTADPSSSMLPDGNDAPPPDGNDAPPPDGNDAPPPDGNDAPPPDGNDAPPPDGNDAPPPDGNDAPPPDGNDAPPPDGNDAPPPDGNDAPPPDGNDAPPPGGNVDGNDALPHGSNLGGNLGGNPGGHDAINEDIRHP